MQARNGTNLKHLGLLFFLSFGEIGFPQEVLSVNTSSPLARGFVGAAYSVALRASGGTQPYTWEIVAGSLPPGLTLDGASGVIAGQPTVGSDFFVRVRVVDRFLNDDTRLLSLTIIPTLAIVGSPPQGTVGVPYSQGLSLVNAVAPAVLTLQSGTLPAGLSFDNLTGKISGTPTALGTFQFVMLGTDSTGRIVVATFTITIGPAAQPELPILIVGRVGQNFSAVVDQSYSNSLFQLVASGTPPGLSVTGPRLCFREQYCYFLEGIPTTGGTFRFSLTAANKVSFLIPITNFSVVSSLSGTAGQPFSEPLALDGFPPYGVTLDSGALPPGLSLGGGGLSGVPSEAGVYISTIRAHDAGFNPLPTREVPFVQMTIVSQLRVTISPSSLTNKNIANAASYTSGSLAPGEIITIFGSGIGPPKLTTYVLDDEGKISVQLANTRILFDGIAAPLLYTSATQLTAIVPYDLDGKSKTQIQVEYKGVKSLAAEVPVSPSAPGLFTVTSTGTGQAAALNQDSSLNSPKNPSNKGSVLVVLATGEGQTDPKGVNGALYNAMLPKPTLPVSLLIDGVPCEIIYVGESPGSVAGLLQVNVKVPESVPTGDQIPIQLIVGDRISQLGVTVSIR